MIGNSINPETSLYSSIYFSTILRVNCFLVFRINDEITYYLDGIVEENDVNYTAQMKRVIGLAAAEVHGTRQGTSPNCALVRHAQIVSVTAGHALPGSIDFAISSNRTKLIRSSADPFLSYAYGRDNEKTSGRPRRRRGGIQPIDARR